MLEEFKVCHCSDIKMSHWSACWTLCSFYLICLKVEAIVSTFPWIFLSRFITTYWNIFVKYLFRNNFISKCYFNYSALNDKMIIVQVCDFSWFDHPNQFHTKKWTEKTENKVFVFYFTCFAFFDDGMVLHLGCN